MVSQGLASTLNVFGNPCSRVCYKKRAWPRELAGVRTNCNPFAADQPDPGHARLVGRSGRLGWRPARLCRGVAASPIAGSKGEYCRPAG